MNNLEIKLDKTSKVKLYHQLYLFFTESIEKKLLPEETKLPSIRTLSEKYGISRNTVTKAYSELEAAGYIYSLSKSGFFVKGAEPTAETVQKKQNSASEIPTVESVLKGCEKEQKEESAGFVTENIDADENSIKTAGTFVLPYPFSAEQQEQIQKKELKSIPGKEENAILMNTGDLVKSSPEKRKIVSPIDDYVDSMQTAIRENRKLLEGGQIPDSMGESTLRIAAAAFFYKFHKMEVNPSQIVVSCSKADILFKLLQLDEFRKPRNNPHGLLQLAEKSISPKDTRPRIAVPRDFHSSMKDVFLATNIATTEIPFDSSESLSALLEQSQATSVFLYSKNITSAKKKQEILEWAEKEDFRYIIEYDTSTEISNADFIYTHDCSGKCIFIENFSNLISKSINATVSVLPKKILEKYRKQYQNFGCPLSILNQITLTDFLIKDKLINYLSQIEQI
ncbi:GntR family transcriptional regulator [Treponema sp.]|uniref:GntR family transcriptional regulator n=1 Tax=Treponema sp. TaxID=166 RepID=UPI003EFBC729